MVGHEDPEYVIVRAEDGFLACKSLRPGKAKPESKEKFEAQVKEKTQPIKDPLDVNNDGEVDMKDVAEVAKGASKGLFKSKGKSKK